MTFFDAVKREHTLNYKFNAGNRVIDLNKEIDKIQLSLCSALVKANVFQFVYWDETVNFMEDAKLSSQILASRCKLGVVKTATYYYRKRSAGAPSAVQSSTGRRIWYNDTMQNFFLDTIQYFEQRLGYVPRFVQYMLMYGLQWRLILTHIPKGILTVQEKTDYVSAIKQVLNYIDDSIVLMQRNMKLAYKIYALSIKYQKEPQLVLWTNDVGLRYRDKIVAEYSQNMICLDFMKLSSNQCEVEGHVSLFCVENMGVQVCAYVNGKTYPCKITKTENKEFSMDEPITKQYCFWTVFPLDGTTGHIDIQFRIRIKQIEIKTNAVEFTKFFPISKRYAGSTYIKNGWCLTWSGENLCLDRATQYICLRKRARQYWSLLNSSLPGAKKGILVRLVYSVLKRFPHKPIWIVSDRVSRADDNGEVFFHYIVENHRKDIRAYFILNKNSADYDRIKKNGPVLEHFSHKQKLMLLMSSCIISSQADEDSVNPFGAGKPIYSDILVDIPFVFLQHGITKDNLSTWLNRSNKNIAGFITAAEPEYHSILAYDYDYTPKQVWLTGFPRFDALKNNPQKIITVMPTWRKYLLGPRNATTDIWSLSPDFSKSEFYKFYYNFFHNERLLNAVKRYGYYLQFLPHPNILPHVGVFDLPVEIGIPSKEMSYRRIYETSSLVITDYSSAIFDFAYLRKPVLYTQFDATSFFSGEHSYEKGYFDYERDGFGEVEYDLESTVDRIIEYMQNGCKLKDKYRERIDRFFAFNDQNNCQRVYEKIMKMEQEI